MAYLFVDDGSHEADEYASNYIYFNENDPGSLKKVLEMARARNIAKLAGNNLASQTENFPAFTSRRSGFSRF